jgi:hypothetical protein
MIGIYANVKHELVILECMALYLRRKLIQVVCDNE